MDYDVFISHASEDKDAIARPLAARLQGLGVKVWLDEFELTLGDSLNRTINRGLSQSKFGIVILSHDFFAKEWPQRELDGLAAREENNQKVILPIWHNITKKEIIKFSPVLGDRLAASTGEGIESIAQKVLRVVRGPLAEEPVQPLPQEKPTVSIKKRRAFKPDVSVKVILLLLACTIVISLGLLFLWSRFNATSQVTEPTIKPTIIPTPALTSKVPPTSTPEITELSNPRQAILKECKFLREESGGRNIDCTVFNNFPDQQIISIEIEVQIPTPTGFQVISRTLNVEEEYISGDEYSEGYFKKKGLPLLESHYHGSVQYNGARLHSRKFKVTMVKTSRVF